VSAELTHGYTVADLCKRWRIGADKVRAFLRRGELVAINVAASLSAKPQWRITPESVERFENRRTSAPAPKPPPRRKRSCGVDFFPHWS
jgi:hypothetical protein